MSVRRSKRKKSSKRRFECSFEREMTDSKRVLASNIEEAAEHFFEKWVLKEAKADEKISVIGDVYVKDHCLWWIVVDCSHVVDTSVLMVTLL